MSNKVFQHSLHRELWQWLSDNPEKDKYQWIQWRSNDGTVEDIPGDCFACNYGNGCRECPLEHTHVELRCLGGTYERWEQNEGNPQERTRLALVIRDLPVKDGVVCE